LIELNLGQGLSDSEKGNGPLCKRKKGLPFNAVGDTFDGKLYRLNLKENEEDVLPTKGHRLNSISPFTSEAHLHPSISPDGKWVLINSSLLTDSDIMLIPLHSD
jgi:hypothetical protein